MGLLELVGFAPPAFAKLRERVRANPYAPRIPDQVAIAADQQLGVLRAGTSGLAGSEADYYTDAQGLSSVGSMRIAQDVTSARRPASTFAAGDPGADPTDPTVLRDFRRGPVRLPLDPWGAAQYASARPHVLRGRINEPTARTPRPKEMVAARNQALGQVAGTPQGPNDALDGLWAG